MLGWAAVWPFKKARPAERKLTSAALKARWFPAIVPEGHAGLDAFEQAISEDERRRLPQTLAKLAENGVQRIHHVRKVDLEPDRGGVAYLDEMLSPAVRESLLWNQRPDDPQNLFRKVVTELGAILGELYVRGGKGRWDPRRAPNLWRSEIVSGSGGRCNPFDAVLRQLSDEHDPGSILAHYDAF